MCESHVRSVMGLVLALASTTVSLAADLPPVRVRYRTLPAPSQSCGPDTLYFVATLKGHQRLSLAGIEDGLGVGPHGCSLQDLCQWARSHRLDAVLARADVSAVLDTSDAGILHVNGDHFVALVGRENGRLILFDNAFGLIDCTPDWFRKTYAYEGDCLLVRPHHGFLFAAQNRTAAFWGSVIVALLSCGVLSHWLALKYSAVRARATPTSPQFGGTAGTE